MFFLAEWIYIYYVSKLCYSCIANAFCYFIDFLHPLSLSLSLPIAFSLLFSSSNKNSTMSIMKHEWIDECGWLSSIFCYTIFIMRFFLSKSSAFHSLHFLWTILNQRDFICDRLLQYPIFKVVNCKGLKETEWQTSEKDRNNQIYIKGTIWVFFLYFSIHNLFVAAVIITECKMQHRPNENAKESLFTNNDNNNNRNCHCSIALEQRQNLTDCNASVWHCRALTLHTCVISSNE